MSPLGYLWGPSCGLDTSAVGEGEMSVSARALGFFLPALICSWWMYS